MPQFPSDPELKAIESSLGELIPLTSRLDRDKLMFQAGAMSKGAAGRRWVWPALTSALALVLAVESTFLGTRPAPRVVERIVVMPAPAPAPGSIATASASASGAPAPTGPENAARLSAAPQPLSHSSWPVNSDYQRFQDLVIRFGLDALPGRPSVVSRSDQSDSVPGSLQRPAGALRSLELARILKPGDPI